jgi:creatinine amidohydrolase
LIIEDMTMAEFKRGLKKSRTLIVPYGTVEAHGVHLPLKTDTLIIEEVVKAASEVVDVFVAPALDYGVCTSTGAHPGTIGISAATLRAMTTDIVRDAFKKGLRNFVLISGHGGGLHGAAMKEAGEALTDEIKEIKIAACSIYEILGPEGFALAETEGDSHAGEMETSAILYLAPDLVKGRSKKEFPKFSKPIIARDKLKFWPGAVWGDPAKADAKKGERLFEIMVEKVVELVKRIDKEKI